VLGSRELEGEPRLAHPGPADDRDQPRRTCKQAAQPRHVRVTPDEIVNLRFQHRTLVSST
jgi:hypothetical protein